MSDNKNENRDVNTAQNAPLLPSPVSDFSKNKKWLSGVLFIAAGVLVAGTVFIHHLHLFGGKVEKEEVSAPSANIAPPTLSPLQQQMNQLKEVMEKQQTTIPPVQTQEEDEAEKLQKMRMVAATTAYSASGNGASAQSPNTSVGQGSNAVLGGNGTGDANTQFMSRLSDSSVPIANATHITHPATTLVQGTMIWATLETRIVSDLPGMIRAVTSEDIYSADGSTVLLPRGSILIGQYTSGIAQGQQRIFAVWQRAIRPDHIDIQISSPGTDPLGAAGIGADAISRHFFEQFGTSALLSIIGAGVANIGVGTEDQFNSASAYREALATSFSQTAQNTLRSTGAIPPTLYKNQGAKISVFVARDLDFFNELTRADNSGR